MKIPYAIITASIVLFGMFPSGTTVLTLLFGIVASIVWVLVEASKIKNPPFDDASIENKMSPLMKEMSNL